MKGGDLEGFDFTQFFKRVILYLGYTLTGAKLIYELYQYIKNRLEGMCKDEETKNGRTGTQ